MATQVKQEINLLDHLLGSLTSGTSSSNERAYIDTTQYNGTVTYYFEVVATNTDSSAKTIDLFGGAISNETISVPSGTTSFTLFRSSAFTITGPQETYARIFDATTSANQVQLKSARIVIIQNATILTNTETQIEIGNYNLARTTEAATILTNPKYWKYDASKWDGTKTFYAEAVYDSGDMDTISVYIYTTSDILAPSWSSAATIVSAATTTVPTRTRVAFTPVDGRWYTIFSLNGSMDNHDIYRAGIVVRQGLTQISNYSESNQSSLAAVGSEDTDRVSELGQSFTAIGVNLGRVDMYIKKVGSPTGNAVAILYAHTGTFGSTGTPTGAALATSDVFDVSTLTTSLELKSFNFSGAEQYSLVNGTNYFIALKYITGDDSNYVQWGLDGSSPSHAGNKANKTNGTWSANSAQDFCFWLYSTGTVPTKLEPQYLLANTLFAAGTGLQTFLTKWDSTEWDDGAGSITYYFQAEAANGSTSDVTLDEADGGGVVTNSTLTNIDNAQISAAMTMPTDQNLDTKATTNAGDVAAARILVTYVFSASAPVPDNVPYTNPNLKALLMMNVGI